MKVNFLICEEVRAELNNKITVVGLYAGDVIVILNERRPEGMPPDTPSGLDRLTILAIITEAAEGELDLKGNLINSTGEVDQEGIPLGKAIARNGLSNTVLIEMKPFIVKEPGIFTFELFVNEEKFIFPFEIRKQD